MARESMSNVLGLTVPVFPSGAELSSSLEPLLSSVKLANINKF